MNSWFKRFTFLIISLCVFSVVAFAQPGPPGDPGGDPDDVPLGGIELLIAAGAAFGAKKWFDKSKKS